MRLPAVAVALLLAITATADELYVPMAARTEVEVVNTSPHRAAVTLEILGDAISHVSLAAGEGATWRASVDDLRVLRVSAAASLRVTAVSRSASAIVSLPVLAPRDAVQEAVALERSGSWRSGLLVVNQSGNSAIATVDDALQIVGPGVVVRGSRVRAQSPLLVFAYDVNEATGARVFAKAAPLATTLRRRSVRSAPSPPVQTQTIVLTPSKDNTLFETTDGSTSNGAGPNVFAGLTQVRSRRRALLAFDIAAQLPPGSRITKATLTMRVSQTISGAEPVALYRVTRDWGEGASNAGPSGDGRGVPAEPGDATWLHTFFPASRWVSPGGDFDDTADATAPVATSSGTWASEAMIARVQQWLDQPATNFGWIAIGNESRNGSAKRFDTRTLTVEFQR
ncbi:MAG TPA: DNRLRE domain-containing protein [Thermoanaerobaculia bacterium]|nr:DNRLRE domain-containing protein [Thermoanaerobaculia bacterium]